MKTMKKLLSLIMACSLFSSCNAKSLESEIFHWLVNLAQKNNIPEDITALNFGMFESDKGYCIYLTGSKFYDENDDDWACKIDFEPKNKYLTPTSKTVRQMDWQEFQTQVIPIITKCIETNGLVRNWIANRIVTAGFDDGELTKISTK